MRARGFFPGGLDPVRDRGPGDDDAGIAPQGPTRRPIRPAVLGDPADGRRRHAMGGVTRGPRPVGPVGVEAPSAAETARLGGADPQVDRPAGADVPQVMQGAPALVATPGGPATPRAPTVAGVAAPVRDVRRREVLHPGDPFGDVGPRVAWPRPDPLLVTRPSPRTRFTRGRAKSPLLCCYSVVLCWK